MRDRESPYERFPVVLLTAALVFAGAGFVCLGWTIQRSLRLVEAMREGPLQCAVLRGQIIHLDRFTQW